MSPLKPATPTRCTCVPAVRCRALRGLILLPLLYTSIPSWLLPFRSVDVFCSSLKIILLYNRKSTFHLSSCSLLSVFSNAYELDLIRNKLNPASTSRKVEFLVKLQRSLIAENFPGEFRAKPSEIRIGVRALSFLYT